MLNVKLLTYTKDCEKVVAAAAKLCYSPSGIEDIFDSIVIDKKKVAHSGIRLDDSESRQKKTKCCK